MYASYSTLLPFLFALIQSALTLKLRCINMETIVNITI